MMTRSVVGRGFGASGYHDGAYVALLLSGLGIEGCFK